VRTSPHTPPQLLNTQGEAITAHPASQLCHARASWGGLNTRVQPFPPSFLPGSFHRLLNRPSASRCCKHTVCCLWSFCSTVCVCRLWHRVCVVCSASTCAHPAPCTRARTSKAHENRTSLDACGIREVEWRVHTSESLAHKSRCRRERLIASYW